MEILLAVAGAIVTVLVLAGMVLITPRGQVDLREDTDEAQGRDLSRAELRDPVPLRRAR